MKSAVTMREIAARAGVSVGTVSHVVNGASLCDRECWPPSANLGYQPSQLGGALRCNQTAMLGMIITDVTNSFFPATVRGG